jgi:transcriptional regulator with XRE-family HTH domain
MTLREVLSFNLRRLRDDRGLSQEDLADAASIDRTYVSALERCVYAASLDVIERLAAALNVGAAELLQQPPRSRRAK